MLARSSIELAWTKILSREGDAPVLEQLQTLFADFDYEDVWELGQLHKMILNNQHDAMKDVLLDPAFAAQINSADSRGRSLVHWAALRGDDQALKLLLQAGANPNYQDHVHESPLHAAARAKSPRCLELLLMAGADPRLEDVYGNLPLHTVCRYQNDVAFVDPLLLGKSCVEARNEYRTTPLLRAALYNRTEIGRRLINAGADVNAEDIDLDVPLFEAVSGGCKEFLSLLLACGARCTHKNKFGWTILHKLAETGTDVDLLHVLAPDKLVGIDVDARETKGRTASDLLEQRTKVPTLYFRAFEKLVDALRDS